MIRRKAPPNEAAPIATTGTTRSASPVSFGRHVEEERDPADRSDRVAERHRDVHGDGVLQHRRVGREPVRELARPLLVEEGDLLADEMREQIGAEPCDDALPRDREEPRADHREDRRQQEEPEERQRRAIEIAHLPLRRDLVDHPANGLRVDERQRARDQERDGRDGEDLLLGARERQQAPHRRSRLAHLTRS